MIPDCCTRHHYPQKKSHKHTNDSVPRSICARQSFVYTQTRQQQEHHHRIHHRQTTAVAQQQHSCSTWYDTCLLCMSPSPTSKNHKNTYDTIPRSCCVRDRASSSHKRDSSSTAIIETTHMHTTQAPQQQHIARTCSKDNSRGGGDLTSPATVYVADLKKKCYGKTRPTNS